MMGEPVDIVKCSPESELLLLAVRIGGGDGLSPEAVKLTTAPGFDWDVLYSRAAMHCVRPQLEVFLKKALPGRAPESFMARLEDFNRQNALRQLRNFSEFFRVTGFLAEQHIPYFPFKGPWLAQQFGESAASRESRDIDLFIRKADLDRVISLMPGLGYGYETSSHPRFVRKMKRISAEFNFDRYEGDTCIHHFEYHWQIGSSKHGLNITYDELASRIVTGQDQDHGFPLPDPSAHLVLVLMHHAGKDFLDQMKHLHDIGLFIQKQEMIDWEWVRAVMNRYGAEKLLHVSAVLASRVTGVPVPEALVHEAGTPAVRRMADERFSVLISRPDGFSSEQYERKNLAFLLRARSGFRVRASMAADGLWSVVRRAVVPAGLMRVYLKKRYSIGGDKG